MPIVNDQLLAGNASPGRTSAPGRRNDPLATFRFFVEVAGILEGWFMECTGLFVQREVVEVKEGGVNNFVHKLPGQAKNNNVILKWGMTDSATLWNWFSKGLYDGQVEYKNVSIILKNSQGDDVRRWELLNAYPVKWTNPDLKLDSKVVSIEILELAYHGLNVTLPQKR